MRNLKKTKKLILSGIIAVIVVYFGYTCGIALIYMHHTKFNNYRQYLWLFNKSVQKDVDTFLCDGNERRSDDFYIYKLNNIHVIIWEFKNLNIFDLSQVSINQNINLDSLKFNSGEKFNKNSQPLPLITVKFKLPFEDFFKVNLNQFSKIIKPFNSKNYTGFYGVINKMSFSNNKGEHLILFDYGDTNRKTLFVLYKGHNQSLYAILINSDTPFDERIIKILNLT